MTIKTTAATRPTLTPHVGRPRSRARSRSRALTVVASMVAVATIAGGMLYAGLGQVPSQSAGSFLAAPTVRDGYIPDNNPAHLDEAIPAIEQLNPELRDALKAAAVDAATDGIPFQIVSGWRSEAYQQYLFDEAVVEYGDENIAAQYVATPQSSSHVTGDAVDLGPLDLQFWLIENGAKYGLCQTYTNERWHWEKATTAGGTCPEMLQDASDKRF